MRIVCFIFLLFLFQPVRSQVRCGTTGSTAPVISYKKGAPDAESPVVTIPVVIHILYNNNNDNISAEQVSSQIEVLNRDYAGLNEDIGKVPDAFKPLIADTRIQFALAKVDPEGRATNGIIRRKTAQTTWKQDDKMKFSANGGSDAWDSRYYLNIWVCRLGNGMLGYSSFPGSAPEKDGVVIRTDIFGAHNIAHPVYNRGRTATHEIGHWLNLKHLWGDQYCGDDDVDDTPPQANYNSGCNNFPVIKPGGCNNSPDGEMFMNFMDFSDDACVLMFTRGQAKRMQQLFTSSGLRRTITESPALGSPWNFSPAPAEHTLHLHVYPNPVSSELFLGDKHGSPVTAETYIIYNMYGQKLKQGSAASSISTYDLAAGTYVLQVHTAGGSATIKFIRK